PTCSAARSCARRSARCSPAFARTSARPSHSATIRAPTRSRLSCWPTDSAGWRGAPYPGFPGFPPPAASFVRRPAAASSRWVVVGGAGTLIGPIIGGVFFVFVEHELSQVTDLWPLVFGSIFIAFVMFAPEGIWGIVTARFKQKPIVPSSAGGDETSDAAA